MTYEATQKSFRRKFKLFLSILGVGTAFLFVVLSGGLVARGLVFSPRIDQDQLVKVLPEKASRRFFVFGDSGTGSEHQRAVADALEKRCQMLEGKVDGILLLGDTFYNDGVRSVTDPIWNDYLFYPYGGSCLKEVAIYPTLGNHDYRGNVEAQIAMHKRVPRWNMLHSYYRIEFGQLLTLIVYDTNRPEPCYQNNRCASDFLLSSLAQSKTRWNFVTAHHPLFSRSAKYDDSMRNLGLRFRSFGIRSVICNRADAYFAGHAHHMEHRFDNECGFSHFISGAGGARLYPIKETGPGFAISRHGFLELDLDYQQLKFKFWDKDLKPLHQGVIQKSQLGS